MNKNIFNILAAAMFVLGLASCSSDEPSDVSIFPTDKQPTNEFDEWLLRNFTYPYNVQVTYRLNDIETDNNYTVVPADQVKAAKLAKLVKYMWFDAYDEVAGHEFLKTYAPRMIMMVGSGMYQSQGTVILGYATGSIKIALCNVNNLEDETFRDIETLNSWYLSTLHHEFQHILNQKVAYDRAFEAISQGDYVSGNWYQMRNEDSYDSDGNLVQGAYSLGFVRNYAMQEAAEDFAETMSDYIVYTDEKFEYIKKCAGGANSKGWLKIQEKIDFIRNYMQSAYNINIDELRTVVQRRAKEIDKLDLEHLD
ncbi:hypothetical protein HPS57_09825 [Prevotella sp. PINT]|jgi:hypothetical protein|uniref:zinc-binding metallopeptidase n=1 Tax=Palleniella intestinalis TaxID=2736291 RepID=UPI001551D9CB|nr:putative zinc-binding metallopeptidase [Palleniella intestinalis]NPD82264.1 hypothetical protein [Palleniella intestinalis]